MSEESVGVFFLASSECRKITGWFRSGDLRFVDIVLDSREHILDGVNLAMIPS